MRKNVICMSGRVEWVEMVCIFFFLFKYMHVNIHLAGSHFSFIAVLFNLSKCDGYWKRNYNELRWMKTLFQINGLESFFFTGEYSIFIWNVEIGRRYIHSDEKGCCLRKYFEKWVVSMKKPSMLDPRGLRMLSTCPKMKSRWFIQKRTSA